MPETARTCMFHLGRCGSTLLGSLVNQHPAMHWGKEPLSAARGLFREEAGFATTCADTMRQWSGFEVKPNQVAGHPDWPTLADFVAWIEVELNVRHWIILKRRNHLRALISSYAAEAVFTQFSVPVGADLGDRRFGLPLKIATIERQPQRGILDWLDWMEAQDAAMGSTLAEKNPLILTYEDHVERDPLVAYSMVVSHLGLTGSPVPTIQYQRMLPGSWREHLINWRRIEVELAGTRYEWMLHDREHPRGGLKAND
jgi:hypothetical protein